MRTIRFLSGIVVFTGGILTHAHAQHNGTGVGAIIGEPTAVTVKQWLNPTQAIQVSMGWSADRRHTDVSLAMDYLWHHNAHLQSGGELPLFYGVGLYSYGVAGVRGTFGASLAIRDVPMDVFFQVHPALSLSPGTRFELHAGLGVRWFFRN